MTPRGRSHLYNFAGGVCQHIQWKHRTGDPDVRDKASIFEGHSQVAVSIADDLHGVSEVALVVSFEYDRERRIQVTRRRDVNPAREHGDPAHNHREAPVDQRRRWW